jgi:hypothetical protein
MLSLSGTTSSTFVAANGLQRAFNFQPTLACFSHRRNDRLLGVDASGGRDTIDYAIGVINGFLVYCSAAGATGSAGGGSGSLTPA